MQWSKGIYHHIINLWRALLSKTNYCLKYQTIFQNLVFQSHQHIESSSNLPDIILGEILNKIAAKCTEKSADEEGYQNLRLLTIYA